MKRTIILLFFSLILFPVFGENANMVSGRDIGESVSADKEITISRVRVFLDDVELTDETDAAISRSTILSFSRIKAERKFTLKSLASECEQTRLRLLNSGFFYNAVVEVVPPRKNPDKRTVIISVTKGFLPRICGGPIYAMYGRVALGGKRNQLIGAAGWNLLGATYTDENFCGLPLIIGASAYTDAPASLFGNDGVGFNGSLTAGSFLTPDWRICVDLLGSVNSRQGIVKDKFIVSPYLYHQHFFRTNLFTETEGRLYYKPAITSSDFSGEAGSSVNYSPVQNLNFGALVCGGTRFGTDSAYDQNFVHDLTMEHTSVSNRSGLSKRAVRSGYEAEELAFSSYFMTSLEARWTAYDFIIAGTFPGTIRPFVFTDLACGKKASMESQKNWNFVDAYGAGLQINFDCPVFAYFNFAYGFNHEGKGKFCFYTGLSF